MNKITIETTGDGMILNICENRTVTIDLAGYAQFITDTLARTSFQGDPRASYLVHLINLILQNNLGGIILEAADLAICPPSPGKAGETGKPMETLRLNGYLSVEELSDNVLLLMRQAGFSPSLANGVDTSGRGPQSPEGQTDQYPLERLLKFQPHAVASLQARLKDDLVAFLFVKARQVNPKGRFILPIYVDEGALAQGGLADYEHWLPAWASMHYLLMLIKIHDFFMQRYGLPAPSGGLHTDLMIALIDLLDYAISPYPQGLQKSIEVGRATAGKCAFITQPVEPFPIPEEIMLALQAKDILGIVPRIHPLVLKGACLGKDQV